MLKAEIIGNLGADAKVMEGNQAQFVSLSVAHQRKYIRQGQPIEETIWVSVAINWNCEKLLPYLKTGTKVFVRGAVRLRTFTGHDGMTHAGMDILADDLELCGSPRIPNANVNVNAETQGQPNDIKMTDPNLPF